MAVRQFLGVKHHGPSGRYRARVVAGGGDHWLGSWSNPTDAAVACDRALLHFGEPSGRLQLPSISRRLGPASPRELQRLARLDKLSSDGVSRYLGVWQTKHRTWGIRVYDGKTVYLSGYMNEKDAAMAYDRLALHRLGDAARLNFPRRKPKSASLRQLSRELKERSTAVGRLTSAYRGVLYNPKNERTPWCACLTRDTVELRLGTWETERAAAIAYDRAALFYRGETAALNFPRRRSRLDPADAETLRAEARQAFKAGTTSRFVGVSRQGERWRAEITHRRRCYKLGRFDTEDEAAKEYDKAARRFRGQRSRPNYHPGTGEELLGAYPLSHLAPEARRTKTV